MRFTYGHLPEHDDAQLASRKKEVSATLLNASDRLGESGRRRLQLDLADIAIKVLESDSYAYWPRKAKR